MNLLFEDEGTKKKINIVIEPYKKVYEAIILYKIMAKVKECDTVLFMFNGKRVNYNLKIYESGLSDNSLISVVLMKENLSGAYSLFNFIK